MLAKKELAHRDKGGQRQQGDLHLLVPEELILQMVHAGELLGWALTTTVPPRASLRELRIICQKSRINGQAWVPDYAGCGAEATCGFILGLR